MSLYPALCLFRISFRDPGQMRPGPAVPEQTCPRERLIRSLLPSMQPGQTGTGPTVPCPLPVASYRLSVACCLLPVHGPRLPGITGRDNGDCIGRGRRDPDETVPIGSSASFPPALRDRRAPVPQSLACIPLSTLNSQLCALKSEL